MLELALLELEEKVKSMADELATIRKYVVRLEEDNRSLQAIVHKKNTAISGKANLQALFDAGFHVCPSHYGEQREEDCLFCVSFMEKQQLEEDAPTTMIDEGEDDPQ